MCIPQNVVVITNETEVTHMGTSIFLSEQWLWIKYVYLESDLYCSHFSFSSEELRSRRDVDHVRNKSG